MKINAWAAKGPKQKLSKYTYEKKLGDNDVLVQIRYCSLLKADIFFLDNFWDDTKYPFVPSSEMFGVVIEKGSNVIDVAIGDYVGVNYQVYACLNCSCCRQGKEQFCLEQKNIGIHEYGGLAEQIIVDSNFVYKIPPKLQKPEYVSLMGYGLTVFSAIKNAKLHGDMNVGVIGVGNLGYLAVQVLVKDGFKVTAFTHSNHKHTELRKKGVTKFINPLDAKQFKKHEGEYDYLLVTTYHSYDWSQIINLLKPEGTLCFLGLPDKDISFPSVLLADYARRSVSGSYIGSRKDMRDLLGYTLENDIKANTQVYEIDQINQVISELRNDTIKYNAVIKIS